MSFRQGLSKVHTNDWMKFNAPALGNALCVYVPVLRGEMKEERRVSGTLMCPCMKADLESFWICWIAFGSCERGALDGCADKFRRRLDAVCAIGALWSSIHWILCSLPVCWTIQMWLKAIHRSPMPPQRSKQMKNARRQLERKNFQDCN